MLDRIIFGDNQFFGINHMSEEKERVLLERFRDVETIIDVMKIAYDCGIRAFMLNTNERANEICDYMRSHQASSRRCLTDPFDSLNWEALDKSLRQARICV